MKEYIPPEFVKTYLNKKKHDVFPWIHGDSWRNGTYHTMPYTFCKKCGTVFETNGNDFLWLKTYSGGGLFRYHATIYKNLREQDRWDLVGSTLSHHATCDDLLIKSIIE